MTQENLVDENLTRGLISMIGTISEFESANLLERQKLRITIGRVLDVIKILSINKVHTCINIYKHYTIIDN